MRDPSRKSLPSADWVAVGAALSAYYLQYLLPIPAGIVLLAVLAPPALRELGWLRDTDEWNHLITYRAGFHALLAVGTLYSLNSIVVRAGWFAPDIYTAQPVGREVIFKAIIWVYIVSYLVQYWGARQGVFRILLLVAVTAFAPLTTIGRPGSLPWELLLVSCIIESAALVGMAFLVLRRPRIGSGLMLLLMVVLMGVGARQVVSPEYDSLRWGIISGWIQFAFILGITGIAVWKESAQPRVVHAS